MEDLIYLYQSVDLLLVIFIRIIGVLAFLPIIEETKMPRVALAGISLGIAIPVFFKMDLTVSFYEPTLISLTIVIVKELIVGLMIGFMVRLYFQIYPFVGSLLSTQGGLGMSMIMDPTAGTQSTLIGRIYNLGLGAFFVLSGGYHWLIYTLIESFEILPINKEIFGEQIVEGMIETMGHYFEIGFKLAMPIISVILIVDFAMGILARTVPQMNMFVIGIPLKMIIMFILMIATIEMVGHYNSIIIESLVNAIINMMQGMRPL